MGSLPTNRTVAEAHSQVIGQHIDLATDKICTVATALSLVAMTPHMLLPRCVVVVGLGTLCVRGGLSLWKACRYR